MKELIKLINVHYEILDSVLLDTVNATVQEGDIVGIIGKNGAGKSTLLQLINGNLQPAGGSIQRVGGYAKTVMVEQETEHHSFEKANPQEMKLLNQWHVPANDYVQLSGGEKLKARLARGLSQRADVLLLDEPTNHLDEDSIQLLIEELERYTGTILFVSHDRHFIDEVATKIWSIEQKKVIEHRGNYSSYMEERRKKRLTQEREYEKQQKSIARIEGQISELNSFSQKAHAQSTKQEGYKEYYRKKAKRMDSQVKSKQKRLEKELEKAKVERVEPEYTVRFSMEANEKVGKRFLEVKDVTKAFSGRTLFEKVHITIKHGEKIALVGPNGSGKTTFLKIILGEEQATGDVWISPAANFGYLTQEVFDLPLDQTPEDFFYKETYAERGKVQNLMKHLGFTPSQWKEPIRNMSMGERVKCKLMYYILEDKDVLILDEPTNHLDLPSREQLEDTLAQYNGTLLVVSHDRYFLEKITNQKLVIADKQILRPVKENRNPDEMEELKLALETDRQEVLGKLSFMTPNDDQYAELDQKFLELTKQIQELSKK
ncbi:ribosomal protection-like ABC-F family protein [Salirhabdus sp. Marseille-P4669]|uniref:ribosomal protection-like ABC-F family protein n=1 Tax=Salirhabdus sp. Marseille-P4669 TaxID=2042310 RepID=UPI000C7A2801|nr:ABC-F type ribosomal protection protein [Salirhabdus sp. Marseille-P4669]